jgi:TRAP-type C4-dicarboxylate transport system permease small subunit
VSESDEHRQEDSDDVLGRLIHLLEVTAAAGLVIALVIVGSVRFMFERVAGVELSWADDVLSALLLWLVMVGSMVAAGQLRHTRAHLLEALLPFSWASTLRRLGFAFSGVICLVLVWYSLHTILLEYEFRQLAFGPVPVWLVQAIVPLGFTIMAARFVAWAMIPPAESEVRQTPGPDPS